LAEQATASNKIFISHSSQDKHIAEELCKALEMKGFGCWICTRDIEGGQNFAKAIVKAIKQSCLLILVFSKNANSSEFVEREVKHAVTNKIPLFPLKTENVEPSDSLDFLIGLNQWLDIYDPPLEKHFPAIISVVSKLAKADEQPKEHIPVVQTQTPNPKPKPLLQPIVRNPFEDNVEYIKIPGGTYKYSVTGKLETVPDLYFCKYLVTNKRYRKFISYLEGKEKDLEEILPLKSFAEKLLEFAGTIEGYFDYLGRNPREWGKELRSYRDEDKSFNGDDQPVVGVSWYAAHAYCIWLSCLQGKEGLYRLPTEKEWEWAAAGREPDGSLREYPWPNSKGEPTPKLANYGNNVGATTPVGRYPEGATPEGLMDMAGNAWEWMENYYDEDKVIRALRGGSWLIQSEFLRCAARDDLVPRGGWSSGGFRVVCEFAPGEGE
jgi:formylglycine-generating enzyme required for sulfatase activity